MADIEKVNNGLAMCKEDRCEKCPYQHEPECCIENLCADAIELLKSQQAEIERLKSKEDALEQMRLDNQDLRQCNSEMKAGIERLTEMIGRIKPHAFNVDVDALCKDIV